jgi:hypothetical protein
MVLCHGLDGLVPWIKMVLCHGLDGLGNWLIEKTECVEGARRDRTWSEYNCCHSSIAGQLDMRQFSSCLNTLQIAMVPYGLELFMPGVNWSWGAIWKSVGWAAQTLLFGARGQLVLEQFESNSLATKVCCSTPVISWSWMQFRAVQAWLFSANG